MFEHKAEHLRNGEFFEIFFRYAVGVGETAEEELNFIASEPQQKHAYYAEDFGKMEHIADKLKTQIHSCEGTTACVSVMNVIWS